MGLEMECRTLHDLAPQVKTNGEQPANLEAASACLVQYDNKQYDDFYFVWAVLCPLHASKVQCIVSTMHTAPSWALHSHYISSTPVKQWNLRTQQV